MDLILDRASRLKMKIGTNGEVWRASEEAVWSDERNVRHINVG